METKEGNRKNCKISTRLARALSETGRGFSWGS